MRELCSLCRTLLKRCARISARASVAEDNEVNSEDERESRKAGMDAHISKPIDLNRLTALLKSYWD